MIHLLRRDSGIPKIDCPDLSIVSSCPSAKHFVGHVGSLDMHNLIHWFAANGSILAVLVTAGVAVLLVCCLGCSNCPSRDKDDIFSRHEM
jgi:predicted DNA-binding helix-hairpin-helix protein